MIDFIIRMTIPSIFFVSIYLVIKDYKETEKEIDEYNKLLEKNQLSAQSKQIIERIFE